MYSYKTSTMQQASKLFAFNGLQLHNAGVEPTLLLCKNSVLAVKLIVCRPITVMPKMVTYSQFYTVCS